MNPYVYSKRKKAAEAAEAPITPTAGALVKSVFSANISSMVAFAVVLLAAGSTMAITALVVPTLAMGDTQPVVHDFALNAQPLVLGASTTAPAVAIISDSSLEAGPLTQAVILTSKAGSFDPSVGRWDYIISYSGLSSSSSGGTLTIGTYVVASGLTAPSGNIDTGAILKPSMTYNVNFWASGPNGGQQSIGFLQIKTGQESSSLGNLSLVPACPTPPSQGQGHASSTPPIMQPLANASSTNSSVMMCLKTSSGKMICPRPPVCLQMGQGNAPMGNASGTPTGTPPGVPGGHGLNNSSSTTPQAGGQQPPLPSPSITPNTKLPPPPQK